MLLQSCTRSRTRKKNESFGKGDSSTDGVEKVERDGVPSQKHQLVLLALRGDKNVVSKGPGNAANRQHGFGPWDQHECKEGHRKGAPLGGAHGVSMRFPEHACYRVIVDNVQMEGAVCMPKLGGTTLDENFAQKDQ